MMNMKTVIKTLAESGIKVTKLDLLGHYLRDPTGIYLQVNPKVFTKADILKQIKKCTTLRTLKIPISLPMQDFTPDFISPNITKLYISLYAKSTCIESILSVFPFLEELYIYINEVGIVIPPECEIERRDGAGQNDIEEIQPKKTYPRLRTIQITHSPIHPGFFRFIKTALSNLDELKVVINLSKSDNSKIYNVDLSGYPLNNCNLLFYESNVDYTITMQNISRRLLAARSLKYPKLALQGYIPKQDIKYVEITVDHIKNFKLKFSSIVKIGNKILVDGKGK